MDFNQQLSALNEKIQKLHDRTKSKSVSQEVEEIVVTEKKSEQEVKTYFWRCIFWCEKSFFWVNFSAAVSPAMNRTFHYGLISLNLSSICHRHRPVGLLIYDATVKLSWFCWNSKNLSSERAGYAMVQGFHGLITWMSLAYEALF